MEATFSWAESPDPAEAAVMTIGAGNLAASYDSLYGTDLQLFESFFNGNINELDYLVSDLPAGPDGTDGDSAQQMSSSSAMGQVLLTSFIKNEPASPSHLSPNSSSSSRSPRSPGESSGPSSPETPAAPSPSSIMTINPSCLLAPKASPFAGSDDMFSLGSDDHDYYHHHHHHQQQQQLLEIKKAPGSGVIGKRGRFSSSDDDTSSPSTPLPANCSPDEERQIKRQRRLIKNRESAQKSRLRKKMYIEDLEAKVKAVVTQSEMLLQENNALKEEIKLLTKYINKTPGLAEEIASSRPKAAAATAPIRNVKAAGVCLLIVLFSFGLFFNNVQQFGDNGPALPFEGRSREPIPEVIPFGGEKRYGHMLKSFRDAVPSLIGETDDIQGGDLTQIFPKRRRPPVDVGPLDSVIQRSEKVSTGLSPDHKIKLEEGAEPMDVVDPPRAEEMAKGFLSVQLELSDIEQFDSLVSQGPRNDTGTETTGHTDN